MPAIPVAQFTYDGWPKQFRELVFDASSSRSSARYPIDWSRTKWQFAPPVGVSPDAVQVQVIDAKRRRVTFLVPGDWTVNLTVTDSKGTPSPVYSEVVPIEPDALPIADFDMPAWVYQGDAVEIRSDSYDYEGEIVNHAWSITPTAGVVGTLTGEGGTVTFQQPGTYSVRLTVTDEYGQTGTLERQIEVKPIIPTAFFSFTGWPKQNRKMVFDASLSQADRYPIDWSRTKWEFIPPVGVPANAVRIVSDPDPQTRQVLFKAPGDWRVRLTLYNSVGNASEPYEQVVTILPDEPPVADFFTLNLLTRDPEDSNYATIRLVDRSYSTDNDIISQRRWEYRFDSDNDGSFADETWILLDGGNNPTPTLRTNRVGKYEFRLAVTEAFGQETIPAFITPADIREANTDAMPLEARTVEVINTQPTVNFDVIRKPKVDVVFTIGETDPAKTNNLATKITHHLETRLAANQIQYTIQSISTSTVSTVDVDAAEIFNSWPRYGTNPETWEFDPVQRAIRRQNNAYWSGFYNPNFSSSDYTLEVEMFTGYDDDDMGITFAMDGGPVGSLAYLFSGDSTHSWTYSNQPTNKDAHAGGLYRYNGSTITGLVDNHQLELQPMRWYHVKLVVSGRNAKIWLDGTLVLDYTADRELKGTFGFFTNSQPWGAFRNLRVTAKSPRTLDDVIREPAWRLDAQHFLVNVADVPFPEFDNPQKAAVIYTQLLQNNVSFSVLGTPANRTQAESVIARNDGNGTFIDNSNIDAALSQLADYIISQVMAQPRKVEMLVLLGEEVEYQTYYDDRESDPEIKRRWLYQHDPTVFKNGQGLASFDGQFLPQPVTRFDKVGRYDVQFQARDNPVGADDRFDNYRLWSTMPQDQLVIYVHRKPIAQFTGSLVPQRAPNGTITGYTIPDLRSTSYDLDHQGESGDGIVAEEWRWKAVTAATWTPGKPTTLAFADTYLVALRVQDLEGAWSDWTVRTYDTGAANTPPVAQFTISPNPLPLSQPLTYTDTSYDPNGDPIVQRKWRVARANGGAWTDYGANPPTNFSSLGVGEYRIELTVQDAQGAWSEPYYQTVAVVPDNRKPVAQFTIAPNPLPVDVTPVYNDTSYDPDGDPIVSREWQYRKNGGPWLPGQPTDFSALGPGTYDIRLRVLDQPALLQMTPLWSDWYQQTLIVVAGNQKPVARFSVSPNPVSADEPVTYIDTSYDPEGLPLVERLWRITDESGQLLGEYLNQLPPTVFANTGWGEGGVGTYRIGLRVRDQSPNGVSPSQWSDWYWQTLTVVLPLTGEAMMQPNPAPSGRYIEFTVTTSGYADKVEVHFPNNNWFNYVDAPDAWSLPRRWYSIVELEPEDDPATARDNVWRGEYKTHVKLPDGTYPVDVVIYRTHMAPETITIRLHLVIQGTIFDGIRVRVRSHGLPDDWWDY